ncbi:MAG: N(4)-(beta-N-acetylglucosaminyl)-L-asparaginase, partial [Bacteroidota bacterium]
MPSRRKFIKRSALGGLSVVAGTACTPNEKTSTSTENKIVDGKFEPKVIATWKPNVKAVAAGWQIIADGGRALDAVEQGAKVPEADPEDQSVGYGGRPDREGIVTLDACIMDEKGNCGSVCFLQNIKHPVAVARKVMEETPHVILSGEGALQFALAHGFQKENLLTPQSQEEWEKWKVKKNYSPVINIENHDTIGILALDKNGDMAGACTTSGAAYKMHGRVGDSPIIGAGMYVDNDAGGAVATGLGEAVLKTLGSFLVVELMRQGMSPQEACEEAVLRIVRKQNYEAFQIGYLAMNKKGEVGA